MAKIFSQLNFSASMRERSNRPCSLRIITLSSSVIFFDVSGIHPRVPASAIFSTDKAELKINSKALSVIRFIFDMVFHQ